MTDAPVVKAVAVHNMGAQSNGWRIRRCVNVSPPAIVGVTASNTTDDLSLYGYMMGRRGVIMTLLHEKPEGFPSDMDVAGLESRYLGILQGRSSVHKFPRASGITRVGMVLFDWWTWTCFCDNRSY